MKTLTTIISLYFINIYKARYLKAKIPKEYLSTKMSLDTYDELTNPREHLQNVRGSLELVIHDNDVMCKILPTTFRGNMRTWYNSLKSGSIFPYIQHFQLEVRALKRPYQVHNVCLNGLHTHMCGLGPTFLLDCVGPISMEFKSVGAALSGSPHLSNPSYTPCMRYGTHISPG